MGGEWDFGCYPTGDMINYYMKRKYESWFQSGSSFIDITHLDIEHLPLCIFSNADVVCGYCEGISGVL